MLVRFTTSNYLSFDKAVSLHMMPGRTRRFPGHVVRDPAWNGINLLSFAVVYGANASGKSNLVKAMSFAQDMIINGTKPRQRIRVKHHRLNRTCEKLPSKFEFEFKHKGEFFMYGFELDTERVHHEWLYRTSSRMQRSIYDRVTSNSGVTSVKFGGGQSRNKGEREFLNFVATGTRSNQLFLTEAIQRNVKQFENVFLWFTRVLRIIFPESRYGGLIPSAASSKDINKIASYIRDFDTGIDDIVLRRINIEVDLLDIPKEVKESISNLEPEQTLMISTPDGERIFISQDKKNRISGLRLMTKHKIANTEDEVYLDIGDESDGTVRMLDLIPTLAHLSESDYVFVIDELDRSLHPNLSKIMVEQFIMLNKGKNSQMIVTTHDTTLLDFNLLRRDEIWFTEKDKMGATSLYSLEEFAPRYDRDIQKGYLLGRFGGIPFLKKATTVM